MKRLAFFAVGALLVGCAPKPEITFNEPTPAATPQPTATPTPAAPAPSPAVAPTTEPTPATKPAPVVTPVPVNVPNPAAIPDTSPSVGAPTVGAPSLPTTAPAMAAAPAKDVAIFETVKDSKTYVFASIAAMSAFISNGTPQPIVSEKPNFTGSGMTIVIEAADAAQAEQMIRSYSKLHPPVAK